MSLEPATKNTDDAVLRSRLDALGAAWARGDAEAYAALFAPDAQYIAFDGTQMDGRAAIAAEHKPLFERWLRGSSLVWGDVAISYPLPDVAIIHSRGAVQKRGQRAPSRGSWSVQTIVAVRRSGNWTFEAFHNTRDRPFASTLLGKLLKAAS